MFCRHPCLQHQDPGDLGLQVEAVVAGVGLSPRRISADEPVPQQGRPRGHPRSCRSRQPHKTFRRRAPTPTARWSAPPPGEPSASARSAAAVSLPRARAEITPRSGSLALLASRASSRCWAMIPARSRRVLALAREVVGRGEVPACGPCGPACCRRPCGPVPAGSGTGRARGSGVVLRLDDPLADQVGECGVDVVVADVGQRGQARLPE